VWSLLSEIKGRALIEDNENRVLRRIFGPNSQEIK
jgi:hypothetical protein